MSSIFNWFDKKWPFVSDVEFIAYAKVNEISCAILSMEMTTSLSSSYQIELLVLSSIAFEPVMVEKQIEVCVSLFESNPELVQSYSGKMISYSYQGNAFNLSSAAAGVGVENKSVYKIILYSSVWNATLTLKNKIFCDQTKVSVIESVLKENNVKIIPSKITCAQAQSSITQYKESDFDFAVRLMEEEDCFCYYDFLKSSPSLIMQSAKEVSLSIISKATLSLVSEIHDNFDFNQIINLKIFDKAKVSSSDSSSIDSVSGFSCDCSAYNLFAGDSFYIKDQNNSLSSINSLGYKYFIEKAVLVLSYKENIGWYIRNHLEGFISKNGVPGYKIQRTTSTPNIAGIKKACICGENENSIYVNPEGKLRVRIFWDETASLHEKTDESQNSIDNVVDPFKEKSSEIDIADVVDKADEIDKNASDLDLDLDINNNPQKSDNTSKMAESQPVPDPPKPTVPVSNPSAIWSVENVKSADLTAWISIMHWGGSGDQFGNYSFPRVGQEVMILFCDGDPNKPFIIGSCFSMESKFPYAIMSKEQSYETPDFSDSVFDKVKDTVEEVIDDPGNFIMNIIDKIDGVDVPNLDPLEKKSISSSSGNLVFRSFSYSDLKVTQKNRWNDLTFFSNYGQEAIRLFSSNYIFLKSANIVNIESVKLIREKSQMKSTFLTGKKFSFIAGDVNEFFGNSRMSFYSSYDPEEDGMTGIVMARLKSKVAGIVLGVAQNYTGNQINADVMENGMRVFVGVKGDYIAVLTEGLFSFSALLGAFNVNTNLSNFMILGVWNVKVFGSIDFFCAGTFDISSTTVDIKATTKCNIKSSFLSISNSSMNIKTKSFGIKSSKTSVNCQSFDLSSATSIGLKSKSNISIETNGALSIKATSISIESKAMMKVSAPVLNLSGKASVKIAGAIISLGPG